MSEPQVVESQPQPNAPPPAVDVPSIGGEPPAAPVTTGEQRSDGNVIEIETPPVVEGEPPASPPSEPASFDQDWRAHLAGGDDALINTLSRFKTPQDLAKQIDVQNRELSKRAVGGPFPADGDEATQKAWREQWGVPDEASLKAYEVKTPEGYEMSEVESGFLDEYVKELHAENTPKNVMQKSVDKWFQFNEANKQNERSIDEGRHQEWSTEVRNDLGKDYEPLTAAANAFIEQRIPDAEKRGELLNARLPGGGIVARHPEFIKAMADLGLQNGYGDTIEANSMEASGKSLAEQHKEIQNMQHSDPGRYDLPATQERLNKIISLRLSRGEIDQFGEEKRR